MSAVNKAILIGRLGADPQIRYTNSGEAVCNFSLATTEKYKDNNGNPQEDTEWHKIVAWSRLAEICAEYLYKGSLIYIEGGLRTRSWEDKEGSTRYTTEIVAKNMQMLDTKQSPEDSHTEIHDEVEVEERQEDIPF